MVNAPRIFLGFRLVALLEIVLFFAVLAGIDHFLGSGNRLTDIAPHPAWLIVLLMAIQYGTAEALLAAAAAVSFLYLGNIPALTFGETRFDYYLRLAWQPLAWFATATLLGEMRVRQRQELQHQVRAHHDAETRADTITTAYNRLKAVKESMEIRLTSQKQHLYDTVQAMNALNYVEPDEMLAAFAEVIGACTPANRFSLYSVHTDGARRVAWRGWQDSHQYPRTYDAEHPLYFAIVLQKQTLSIHHPDHEDILGELGIMAMPILNPYTHEVLGMLKVEEMPFLEFSQPTVELLRTLCDWFAGLYVVRHPVSSSPFQGYGALRNAAE